MVRQGGPVLVDGGKTEEEVLPGKPPFPQVPEREIELPRLEVESERRNVGDADGDVVERHGIDVCRAYVRQRGHVFGDGAVDEEPRIPAERRPPVVHGAR
jgi:hypothetical protein